MFVLTVTYEIEIYTTGKFEDVVRLIVWIEGEEEQETEEHHLIDGATTETQRYDMYLLHEADYRTLAGGGGLGCRYQSVVISL